MTINRWYFSILQLLIYVGTFLFWKWYPSRIGFIVGGVVSVSIMSLLLVFAARRKYFVNRVDLCLHLLVIVDIGLESLMYEVLRFAVAMNWMSGEASVGAFDETAAMFHNNHNFYMCALFFAVVIGGHHWFRRESEALQTVDRQIEG
ncbi:hypothetical protein [Symmachiella dynata]|uniref:hypothetical protein n=1 Tax=Symmachiella dynata TaxID=2527995 RepID=UPI0030EB306C|tara:strand:- start:903 stop:1343 length:441 start_codon:yes stop_codon:yes gene_type:complete